MKRIQYTPMLGRLAALALSVVGLGAAAPSQALPPDLDGSWFDPAHSGHGLTVERIDAGRALLFWHTFDPQGQPLTLYIETAVEGDRLRGMAWAPQGMRFGAFDPQTLQLPEWGEVSLQFSDCQNAVLRWRSRLPGYGEGEAPLQRLLPGPADCALGAPAGLLGMDGYQVSGPLRAEFTYDTDYGVAVGLYLTGHVDPAGVLRATMESYPAAALTQTPVLIGEPRPSASGRAELRMRYLRNRLGDLLDQVYGQPLDDDEGGEFHLQLRTRHEPRGAAAYDYSGRNADFDAVDIRVQPSPRQRVRAGIYGDPPNGELSIGSDGSLCLRIAGDPLEGPCRFSGRILGHSEASFRFELREAGSDEPAFTGSGVALDTADVAWRYPAVQLIGDNGRLGFYYESSQFRPAAD